MANVQWIYDGTTNSIEWKCRIIVDQFNQSIVNNTSDITVTFQFTRARSSSYGSNGATTAYITIDGAQYSISVPAYNYGSIGVDDWKTIATKTVTVNHDSVGWRSVNVSCSWSQGVQPTSCSASGTPVLTVIPRASGVTCNDGNIGSSTTINITRANSRFTHKLEWWYNGSTKGGDIASNVATTCEWTIPTVLYSKIPNAKFIEIIIYCYTYDGSTQLGYTSCRVKCFVVNSEPIVSAAVTDSNSAAVALTGSKQKLIKGVSNANIVTTATAKNSATISKIEVSCADGKSGIGANVTLNSVTAARFIVKVTDSRGFTTTIIRDLILVDYVFPAVTELNIARVETSAPLTKISVKGNIFNGSFGTVTNARQLCYFWRENGQTAWSPEIILTPTTVTGNTFTYEANLNEPFDVNKPFDFVVRIKDKVTQFDKSFAMGKSVSLITLYKDGIDISGFIKSEGNHIVESGTGINGSYTKYYDGTMMVHGKISKSIVCTGAYGSMFYGYTDAITFPTPFYETPTVIPTISGKIGAYAQEKIDAVTTSAFGAYVYNPVSGTFSIDVKYVAIGRWKKQWP